MKTDQEKLLYISQWQESGLSSNEYCRQKQIPESTFRGWRKKLLNPSSSWKKATIIEESSQKEIPGASLRIELSILRILSFTFQIERCSK